MEVAGGEGDEPATQEALLVLAQPLRDPLLDRVGSFLAAGQQFRAGRGQLQALRPATSRRRYPRQPPFPLEWLGRL